MYGADALTMRAVANALGTGAMTLYHHVKDRDDLETLVADAVFADVDLPRPAEDWTVCVEGMSLALWRALRAHPNTIHFVSSHRGKSPAALDVAEQLLRALEHSGAPAETLVVAFRAILAVIIGGVEAEPRRLGETDFSKEFAALTGQDGGSRPRLAALTSAAAEMTPEVIFIGMVRKVINGLSSA